MPPESPEPEEDPEGQKAEEEGGEDDAADVVKGVLGCKSTLTELLVDWMVRCSSPATTSTSSGGRTARVITTGAKAGAGLGSTAVGGGVRGFDFGRA